MLRYKYIFLELGLKWFMPNLKPTENYNENVEIHW